MMKALLRCHRSHGPWHVATRRCVQILWKLFCYFGLRCSKDPSTMNCPPMLFASALSKKRRLRPRDALSRLGRKTARMLGLAANTAVIRVLFAPSPRDTLRAGNLNLFSVGDA
eukprot:Skav229365  [mRNA]  locus=scaffold3853:48526:55985:+ [translate_table: standard]